MPTSTTVRRIIPAKKRNFGRISDEFPVPDLTQIQTRSYERFLQADLPADKRGDSGLEGVFREIFPIESYDKTLKLEYLHYDLGKPRYDPDECRQLRLTYGRPLHVWLRLNKGETTLEESVYLGDMPIMIGGGEFIINGAERVVVSQLHRSPGRRLRRRDRVERQEAARLPRHPRARKLDRAAGHQEGHAGRADRPVGQVLVDDAAARDEPEVLERRGDPRRRSTRPRTIDSADPKAAAKLEGRIACGDVVDPTTGEVLIDSGTTISKASAQVLADAGNLGTILVLKEDRDPLILQSLQEDPTTDHESALLADLPAAAAGQPAAAREGPRAVPREVLRHQPLPAGQGRPVPDQPQVQPGHPRRPDDARPRGLRQRDPLHPQPAASGKGHVDDIDHLGNRRLRTIDELASDELRKGFLKLRRTVQERMSLKDAEDMTPRSLINPKSISAAIEYFFGRGELSQVVDQTNPLAQLTHERRLSALGPGGLNRKRAGFEVRDVHISHYGRICPIETPEGTNIGLISSLGIYGGVDEYGFLITPYRKIKTAR